MNRGRDRLDQRRRIGIVLERPHAHDPAILDLGEKGAPMRMVADERHGHEEASDCRCGQPSTCGRFVMARRTAWGVDPGAGEATLLAR